MVVAVGGAYKLGFDNGNSKFDKEKIEMNKENEISYQNSKIKQNANSKKEFTRLLKEIECSGIVIQKPYYTTPRLAINQLLQSGKGPHP